MRIVPSAILLGLMLGHSVEAWGATAEDAFLRMFKRFGITNDGVTSKRPCLCTGGTFDQRAGRLIVFKSGISFRFDCQIPFYDDDGDATGGGGCIGLGGTVTLIDK